MWTRQLFSPPSDVAVQQAVRVLKPGGIAVLDLSAQVGEWSFDEKRLVSTALGPRHQMNEVLRLAAAGKLRVVHEVFALEDAPIALARLKADTLKPAPCSLSDAWRATSSIRTHLQSECRKFSLPTSAFARFPTPLSPQRTAVRTRIEPATGCCEIRRVTAIRALIA